MSGQDFVFREVGFRPWLGRYKRISSKTTFKVLYTDRGWWPVIEWVTAEGIITCIAVGEQEVAGLVDVVNRAKKQMYGNYGGSFVINEFGQVIVPSSAGDGTRLLVGETEGTLLFDNPLAGGILDLSDDAGLNTGDHWDRPYIGMRYNLTRGSSIYFWKGEGEYLPHVDDGLINKLRAVRRTGAVRFIVNPYGIVLVKAPQGEFRSAEEEDWQPIYVGRITPNRWFAKEEF